MNAIAATTHAFVNLTTTTTTTTNNYNNNKVSYFSFHIITYYLVHGLSASLPLKFGIPYLFTLGNHNHSPHSDAI